MPFHAENEYLAGGNFKRKTLNSGALGIKRSDAAALIQ
jgi:hypothetical protein